MFRKILLLILLFTIASWAQDNKESTVLRGPYLGQIPPGDTPKLFASGFISTKNHSEFSLSFSNDGKTLYFSRRIGKRKIS